MGNLIRCYRLCAQGDISLFILQHAFMVLGSLLIRVVSRSSYTHCSLFSLDRLSFSLFLFTHALSPWAMRDPFGMLRGLAKPGLAADVYARALWIQGGTGLVAQAGGRVVE